MRVSIIIPALNEAAGIAFCVERARAVGACEVLVVDGGSSDGTPERAFMADRVLSAPRGRARQQNLGAAQAKGDVLLFLHADCWLQPGSLDDVTKALADANVVGGCFRQRIDAPGLRFRWLERGNALRVRLFRLAYGDQAIFVRRAWFERLGGFPDEPFLEDLLFMKRLARQGRIALLPDRLVVSARRWQARGVVRQTLSNWWLTLAGLIGVSPRWLARFYGPVR
jgi:rSAM/selenodomain-associated transferase 2